MAGNLAYQPVQAMIAQSLVTVEMAEVTKTLDEAAPAERDLFTEAEMVMHWPATVYLTHQVK